jgi:Ca2+-binding RTX toxin-like protein
MRRAVPLFPAGLLLLLAVPSVSSAAYVDQLKRYPYLTDVVNSGATGYATVNWATDRSGMTGSVRWGQVSGDGSCAPVNSVAVTRTGILVGSVLEYQWKAGLSLAPDTQYCYRVFLDGVDLLGTDPSPRFWTQASRGSLRFAVFGDWGYTDAGGANPDQANVIRRIAESGARFAVTTGDQPQHGSGSQTNWGDLVTVGQGQSTIFGPSFWTVAGAQVPLFATLGNHGLNSAHLTNLPQDRAVETSGGRHQMDTYCCLNGTASASYPSVWYAFDAGGARFYVVDTAWPDGNVGAGSEYENDYDYHWTTVSAEYQWLKADLEAHSNALKFAFFHFPLYSDVPNEPGDTFLRGPDSLEGLLSRHGVDIAFTGHAHTYQRNLRPPDGVVSYVTGGGGARLVPVGPCSAIDAYGIGWSNSAGKGSRCSAAPAPTAIDQVYHFLLVTVNGTSVTVTPTDELGRTFDVQTYDFSVPPPAGPPAPEKTRGPDRRACATVRRGTGRHDRIRGTRHGDKLVGLRGNDRLGGLPGDDCLFGGPGSDRLSGHDDDDRLSGGRGNDRLRGGPGRNRLLGGPGNDRLNGVNRRIDRLECGRGRDRARADRGDRVRGCERVRRGARGRR